MGMRVIYLVPAGVFLLFLVLAAWGLYGIKSGTRQTQQLPSVLIGQVAPDLPKQPLTPLLARQMAEFRGQPVLVNFMASWCIPCRAEIPALDILKNIVPIIAVAYKDSPKDTADFLETYGNPYRAVWMDNDGRAGIAWGIYGVPETYLIDGEGRVVLRHAGPVYKSVITDVIMPALAKLNPPQKNLQKP